MTNRKNIHILLLCVIVIGVVICALYLTIYGDENNSAKENATEGIDLADNEISDGKIIFTIPESYECKKQEVQVDSQMVTCLMINNETFLYYGIIASFYDTDTSPMNFEAYWKKGINEEAKRSDLEFIDEGMTIVKDNECHFRVAKYKFGSIYVYVRAYLLFDSRTDKMCMMILYDNDSAKDYEDELLESIRFI